MPWIDVSEPHATPPNLLEPTASDAMDRPMASMNGMLRADEATLDAQGVDLDWCSDFVAESSVVRHLHLGPNAAEIDSSWSRFEYCDLSSSKVRRLRSVRMSDCKFAGTDFSGSELTDVVFERCVFSYANLRMSKLTRVQFEDCGLSDVDAFEMVATDLCFDGSELNKVNIDRLKAIRVDLRGAVTLGFEGLARMDGLLVSEQQLSALVFHMAFGLGLGVERTDGR